MASGRSRSDRMRSIEALSNREAQDLAAQMESRAQAVRDAESRLLELEEYLEGYVVAQTARSQEGGVSAMQLSETHIFLERLKQAVELQRETVAQSRSAYEASRARWIAQHVRTSALGSAVHRFEQEEARVDLLREQRSQDEIAARYHRPPEEEPAK